MLEKSLSFYERHRSAVRWAVVLGIATLSMGMCSPNVGGQERAVPRTGSSGSSSSGAQERHPSTGGQTTPTPPAYNQPAPQGNSGGNHDRAVPRSDAEKRHPRPDGRSTRPTVPGTHFQPWEYYPGGPLGYYPGYPYWGWNGVYGWDWNTRCYVLDNDNSTRQERNIAKEDYYIYRLKTGTPVILEDLILTENVLGYNEGQMEYLLDVMRTAREKFLEAEMKYAGDPEKIREKQLAALNDYKKDMKDFLGHEKTKRMR